MGPEAHAAIVLSELTTDHAGRPRGNAIELKTYVDVESTLGRGVGPA